MALLCNCKVNLLGNEVEYESSAAYDLTCNTHQLFMYFRVYKQSGSVLL